MWWWQRKQPREWFAGTAIFDLLGGPPREDNVTVRASEWDERAVALAEKDAELARTNLKVKKRALFNKHVCAGDTIKLVYTDAKGVRHDVVEDMITKPMTFTEAVVVDGAFEGKDAVGGLFLGKRPD